MSFLGLYEEWILLKIGNPCLYPRTCKRHLGVRALFGGKILYFAFRLIYSYIMA